MGNKEKIALGILFSALGMCRPARAIDKVLILTRTVVTATSGYRESNIAPTRLALKNFLEKKGLAVDTSESDTLFTDATLAKYKTVIFLKTSGNILNAAQHAAFERYFRAGGGFIGIHSALDTEYGWAFYGQILAGGYYKSLGGSQTTKETVVVEDSTDISIKFLPHRWPRTDEVYNLVANPRTVATVRILLTLDESTYPGGVAGTDHPVSWKNELLGGRAWITSLGHTTESYSDSLFLNHVWGGLQYTMGRPATSIPLPRYSLAAAHRKSGAGAVWSQSNGWLFREDMQSGALLPRQNILGRNLSGLSLRYGQADHPAPNGY